MQELRANTQVKVVIGPVVAVANGYVPVTTLDLSTADEAELMKHDAAAVVDISAATFAAITSADGYYNLTLTTSHTDTEGMLTVLANDDSLCLPVKQCFMVLSEAAWDSKYIAKDDGFMDVNVKTIGRADTQETEATNLEAACAAYSATRGLAGTALPAAAADGVGGLPISDAGGLDLDAKLANTNEVTVARMGALTDLIDGGRLDLLIDAILADTGTDGVVVAAGSKTGYSLTATTGLGNQTANLTGNLSGSVGSVTGSVGSVTGAVGSVTGNVGGNVTGSVGSVTGSVGSVTGNVGGSVASVATGGIAAASFAAGAIDAAAIATNAIDADALATDAVTEIQSGLATPTNITAGTITTVTNLTNAPTNGDLTATMKTSVNAEVLDVLNVDTFTQPGQENPAATTTLRLMLAYLYKAFRNKSTQTSSEYALYADDGTTKDQESACSDDGTTFTKGEIGTGA